jgi:hypothetical protein
MCIHNELQKYDLPHLSHFFQLMNYISLISKVFFPCFWTLTGQILSLTTFSISLSPLLIKLHWQPTIYCQFAAGQGTWFTKLLLLFYTDQWYYLNVTLEFTVKEDTKNYNFHVLTLHQGHNHLIHSLHWSIKAYLVLELE